MTSVSRVHFAIVLSASALCALSFVVRSHIEIETTVALLALSFIPYAGLWFVDVEDWEFCSPFLVCAALSIACTGFLGLTPQLSTDVYRYFWDGRALLAGHNPLCVAPWVSGHSLAPANYDSLINHGDLSSPYPIGAQLLFASMASVGDRLVVGQIFAIGAHALSTFLLWRIGSANAKRAAAVYALNPLLIVEAAWSAHLDFFVGFFLLLGALLYSHEQKLRGALAWSGAALLKMAGLLPLCWLAMKQRKYWLLFVGVLALLLLPPALCGDLSESQHGLRQFAERWSGHTIFFPMLETMFKSIASPLNVAPHFASIATRGSIALLLLLLAFYLSRTPLHPILVARGLIFALLLLSPQFHPWYIAWLLPLEAASQRRAGFVLSATMLGTYLPLGDWNAARVWSDSALFLIITSTIVCITLVLEYQEGLPPVGKMLHFER